MKQRLPIIQPARFFEDKNTASVINGFRVVFLSEAGYIIAASLAEFDVAAKKIFVGLKRLRKWYITGQKNMSSLSTKGGKRRKTDKCGLSIENSICCGNNPSQPARNSVEATLERSHRSAGRSGDSAGNRFGMKSPCRRAKTWDAARFTALLHWCGTAAVPQAPFRAGSKWFTCGVPLFEFGWPLPDQRAPRRHCKSKQNCAGNIFHDPFSSGGICFHSRSDGFYKHWLLSPGLLNTPTPSVALHVRHTITPLAAWIFGLKVQGSWGS